MKKIFQILAMTLIALSASAQSDTSDLKTLINANFPDNTSGYITPERIREVHVENIRSNANLLERNTFSETVESLDSIKSDEGFFQWNGSGWTEVGGLSDTSLWSRSGGYIVPKEFGDTLQVRNLEVSQRIQATGKPTIGNIGAKFDTLYVETLSDAVVAGGDFFVAEDISVSGKIIGDTINSGGGFIRTFATDSVILESGQIVIRDGSQEDGYVLTSDSDGRADWQPNDHGSGWAQYTDTTYKSTNKFTITEGDTSKFPLFWDEKVDSQLPFGVDSLFSRADTSIIGRTGDAYMLRMNFKAEVDAANGHCDLLHDIGNGTPIIINDMTITFPRGANQEHEFSKTVLLFSLGTFQSNGCSIKFYAEDGNLEVWDFSIIIARIHKAFE
jgi:hypothetical protein